MFIHNLKYTIKTLFRDKILIFWTFAFPLILGTFFQMAFSNIEKSEKLSTIDFAVVKNEKYNNSILFKEALPVLSNKESEQYLLNTRWTTEEKAKRLLEDEKIAGYLVLEETPKVVVMKNGIEQTIIKQVIDEIATKENTLMKIAEEKVKNLPKEDLANMNSFYASIYKEVLDTWNQKNNTNDVTNSHLSYTMIEFYTLIAMTCLYGGLLGMIAINRNLANMSSNGKRVAVSPSSKAKLIVSSALAGYITQLIGVLLLFLYTIFLLQVDYGNHLFHTILLTLVGCFAGLSLGIAIATLCKTNENTKTGIIIAVTMLGCFLSGMMGITMKYLVDKNLPLINKLNPAAMITDGFYSLYYYETFDRFNLNIVSLLVFSACMIALSIYSLRRQRYDSI